MPAEVKVLIEGYTNADSFVETGEEKIQPTVTLVRDGDVVMVVDPGILESQQVLVDALKKEDLSVEDVNVVCITHSHIDHYRNIGMFPNAKILEYYGLWDKRTVSDWSENFTSNIRVLHTPGHDYSSITLFVTTGSESGHPGVVAICGDVFWKENYPREPQDDAYASNPEKLKESREVVKKMADWIVPGHGGIYNNDKSGYFAPVKESPIKQPKISLKCKKCDREMTSPKDKCFCRPYLCFICCECGLDCDLCYCSHQKKFYA